MSRRTVFRAEDLPALKKMMALNFRASLIAERLGHRYTWKQIAHKIYSLKKAAKL